MDIYEQSILITVHCPFNFPWSMAKIIRCHLLYTKETHIFVSDRRYHKNKIKSRKMEFKETAEWCIDWYWSKPNTRISARQNASTPKQWLNDVYVFAVNSTFNDWPCLNKSEQHKHVGLLCNCVYHHNSTTHQPVGPLSRC